VTIGVLGSASIVGGTASAQDGSEPPLPPVAPATATATASPVSVIVVEPPSDTPPSTGPADPLAPPVADPVTSVTVPAETPAPSDGTAPAPTTASTEPVPIVPTEAAPPAPAEVVDAVVAPEPLVLAASQYDTIYANGLPVGVAMATSRLLESGNDYAAQAPRASASGAYQIIDAYWNNYGGYPRALLAPQEVQDQFAYEQFVAILKRNGNNLAAIPVAWYYPAALRNPALMDIVPMPEAGNRLTIREYQQLWLATFFELLGEGSPPYLPISTDPLIPSIAFPVLGPVEFWHDFGAPRGKHGERRHEGLDMIGTAGQPLRAAFDGTVTRIQVDPLGIAGVVVTVTRADGIRANYFHINDDNPGTTDGLAPHGLRIHPGIRAGDAVKAGQVIAYMGDTGNAVGLPHLHFEIRTPEGIPIDPYPAVLAAQQREQCSVGIGPWATDFVSPAEEHWAMTQLAALTPHERDVLSWIVAARPPLHTIAIGEEGARWEVDAAGTVRATGEAALIQPGSGECITIPDPAIAYGTRGAGVGRDLLPPEWWEVGGAYAGPVGGDDLEHGDGVRLLERPPQRTVLRW
jgi:hypothetical protein